MHVRPYLRSLPATYPLSLLKLLNLDDGSIQWASKWATILSVAGALSMLPPLAFAQAGISTSAAGGPSLESGGKVVPARHVRRMFGEQGAAGRIRPELHR